MAATAENLVGWSTLPARARPERRRGRGLGWGVLLGLGAAAAGAVLGLVASPGPGDDHTTSNLAWTSAAAVQTAKSPEFQKRMHDLGYNIIPGSPEDMARMIQAELKRWGPIVKASGAKVD